MHHDSSFRQPGNEGDKRDQQRRASSERRKARRIAAGNLTKRRADDQRNCGSNGDSSVARTAEDPEDQSAEQAGVKAGFRRQIG